MAGKRLTRRFYRRDPVSLAKALLGQVLVRILADGTRLSGRIVETEAYLGIEDRAAHSFGGRRTPRVASMYLDAGHAYVYFTYGMHWCLNVSADRPGVPTACLIRALEPLEGLDAMRIHRGGKRGLDRVREVDLCSGPAKLTQALQIDRALDGADLTSEPGLFLEQSATIADNQIITTARIGIGYAAEWALRPLRFCLAGSPHVSVRVESGDRGPCSPGR